MKKNTKIAVSVAAIATTGALAFAAPSFAHDRAGKDSSSSQSTFQKESRNHVELSMNITGIPADVTAARDAAKGANYKVYKLAEGETSLPSSEPTTPAKVITSHPERAVNGSATEPVITDGVLTGELGFPAGAPGTTNYFALYPSDGGAAVLVTVIVDADGVASATSSSALSVSYSADVAATAPTKQMGHGGPGMNRDHRGGHGRGPAANHEVSDLQGVTPNA